MSYPYNERQARFIAIAQQLAPVFTERAAEFDRTGAFPHPNFADIRAAGLPKLIIPEEFGGWGANLLETVMVMEALGKGDGSTALSLTMHMQTMGHAAETRSWPAPLFEQICRDAVEKGWLINSIASEPELGSPSRGGKPKTTAKPIYDNGDKPTAWLINGHKNWASMVPELDYMIVPALLQDGSEEVARFVVPKGPGLRIEETWDALGMRSTGSHDLFLENVEVPHANLLNRGDDAKSTAIGLTNAWFMLTVSAVYLGVAESAIAAAAKFARNRIPTALGKPIATTENIQRHMGQAQFLVQQAQAQLYHVAQLWVEHPNQRVNLGSWVNVAKVTTTNNAIEAVDHCMRVVGGLSMMKTLPLERYYRDVRGGLNHPVNDDVAYIGLGKQALSS
ncbi:MAG: acyl-CoA dehydrogenase family protein [Caldilineaceae bacterium]